MANRLRRKRLNTNVVINSDTRLFIAESPNDCCCPTYEYHSCTKVGDLAQTRAAKTKVWCPSPTKYNEFVVIQEIDGEIADGTGQLSTNYTLGNSTLERLFKNSCLADLQIHIGHCTDPSDFSLWERAIILEDVEFTDYGVQNLFASQSSEQGVVTESASFTFYNMITVEKPEPSLDLSTTLFADGPIIDSFTFCDTTCCLCPNSSGRYLVQLVKCNDDCACGNECAKARILYQTDCKTWKASSLPVCEGVDCTTLVNKNVIKGVDGSFSYVHLNGSFGDSISNTLSNATAQIPSTALITGSELRAADGCDTTVLFVGDDGYIFKYDTVSKDYEQVTGTTIPLININYCSVSFCPDDCDIAFLAADNGRVIKIDLSDNSATTYTMPDTTNQVHLVEAISCCSFLAASSSNLYHVCNGTITTSCGFTGNVTAIEAVNEYVVYLATYDGVYSHIWMSIDGGRKFQEIETVEKTGYVVTTISACYDNPGTMTYAGHIATSETAATAISCTNTWGCDDTGFSGGDGGCP